MQDSEVASIVRNRVREIEDNDMRAFIDAILDHENEGLERKRPEFRDEYKKLVDSSTENMSLGDFDDS